MDSMLGPCMELSRGPAPRLPDLVGVVRAVPVDDESLDALRKPDPTRPYGRNVFLDSDVMEGMVATWTRGVWCAPHDHGGSVGAVRVLRGAARHRVWRLVDGELELVLEERVEAGRVLSCGPDLIHSMADAGDEQGLMTLHVYSGPIPYMVVYDQEARRTCIVDGGCGAWVPHDQPELLRESHDGFLRFAS